MIGIIDYGVGNIKAFENIYNRLHIPVKVLKSLNDFVDVNKLILPGVGAFDHTMQTFIDSGMREITEQFVFEKKVPIMGICVGMQLLAKGSDEGVLEGLGWIDGIVKKFDESKIEFDTHLPHMGWNDVDINRETKLFKDFPDDPKFYFLHSYYFVCNNPNNIIATSNYGIEFSSAVACENIYGVQFHPEKSHQYGVKLLENFSKI